MPIIPHQRLPDGARAVIERPRMNPDWQDYLRRANKVGKQESEREAEGEENSHNEIQSMISAIENELCNDARSWYAKLSKEVQDVLGPPPVKDS